MAVAFDVRCCRCILTVNRGIKASMRLKNLIKLPNHYFLTYKKRIQRSLWNIKNVNKTLLAKAWYRARHAAMGTEEQRHRKPGSPEPTIYRCPRPGDMSSSMPLTTSYATRKTYGHSGEWPASPVSAAPKAAPHAEAPG